MGNRNRSENGPHDQERVRSRRRLLNAALWLLVALSVLLFVFWGLDGLLQEDRVSVDDAIVQEHLSDAVEAVLADDAGSEACFSEDQIRSMIRLAREDMLQEIDALPVSTPCAAHRATDFPLYSGHEEGVFLEAHRATSERDVSFFLRLDNSVCEFVADGRCISCAAVIDGSGTSDAAADFSDVACRAFSDPEVTYPGFWNRVDEDVESELMLFARTLPYGRFLGESEPICYGFNLALLVPDVCR